MNNLTDFQKDEMNVLYNYINDALTPNLPNNFVSSGFTKEGFDKLVERVKNEKPPKHNLSFFALTKEQIMAVDDGSVDELKEEIKDCSGRLFHIEDYLFQRVVHWHMVKKEKEKEL